MKVELHSTDKIVELKVHGVYLEARIWEGTSAGGVPVIALIPRIAARLGYDHAEFHAELRECAPPTPDAAAWSDRMILH